MSLLTLEAKLERAEPTTPWGFRMQGGKDFHSPLTIQKVNPGSLAAKCGLQAGDILLKIGNHGTDVLRHKEAQDFILHSGNRLDLLLQRGTPVETKFSTPTISSFQSPGSGSQFGQNYNIAPKPFGTVSGPAGHGPGVDNISQQTQNLSISSNKPPSQPPNYQKYTEHEERPDPASIQSRSFKYLQQLMDSGQEPPSALKPVDNNTVRRSPSPQPPPGAPPTKPTVAAAVNVQYNTPVGLYSDDNVVKATRVILEPEPEATDEGQGPPSSGPPPAPPAPPPFKVSGPKPGVWSPGQKPAGQTPAAKPFNPVASAPPPAPAAPRAPPPRPTGTGSKRGKKGDAVFKPEAASGSTRVPVCASCGSPIRGPFVMAMGKSWCPEHFVCANPRCGMKLLDIGFVEEGGFLYCEKDYELYFAPKCSKCNSAIIGECVNALNQTWHPQCFLCYHCKQPIGGGEFHLEDNHPYCTADWNKLFQTMCFACSYPIEPGDKWVEAMNNNFHSECFNCSTCQVNLEGQPFYSKGGKPYCKKHAR